MKTINRMKTDPIDVKRSKRNQSVVVLTSLPAGKVVPIYAGPVLREESMTGAVTVRVEMMETKELLMNGVTLRLLAYFVPDLARPKFEGDRGQLDRSFMGQPKVIGGAVVPYYDKVAMGAHGSNQILKYLGKHGKPTDMVNTQYIEAYNLIDRMRATNRSPDLSQRALTLTTLAPAFWSHSRFEHVVPDFDQAVIDGEVALNVVSAKLPVTGLGIAPASGDGTAGPVAMRETVVTRNYARFGNASQATPGPGLSIEMAQIAGTWRPQIFAEMQENGITVSLAKLKMAATVQSFAKVRESYQGYSDEYIIDMLMDGLTIPEQHFKQPILLDDVTVPFVQAKRYATDSGNLAESATSGMAQATVSMRIPRQSVGGTVMILAEALPVQLFERQRDPMLHIGDVDDLPQYLRDTLDPEKVDVVFNREIDTDHDTPNAHFGYAPMNWKWTSFGPNIGGKFYRPDVDAPVDEERKRLWAVETANPTLSEDFYRVSPAGIHLKPFLDEAADPFELSAGGNIVATGNTVFGGMLVEATNNYDKVAEKAPTELIEKP